MRDKPILAVTIVTESESDVWSPGDLDSSISIEVVERYLQGGELARLALIDALEHLKRRVNEMAAVVAEKRMGRVVVDPKAILQRLSEKVSPETRQAIKKAFELVNDEFDKFVSHPAYSKLPKLADSVAVVPPAWREKPSIPVDPLVSAIGSLKAVLETAEVEQDVIVRLEKGAEILGFSDLPSELTQWVAKDLKGPKFCWLTVLRLMSWMDDLHKKLQRMKISD